MSNAAKEVVVVSGVRTAIGDFGGSLKDFSPTDLGAKVVREVLSRANVSGDAVGHVVFGHVVNTEPKDMYIARVAAIDGGVAQHTPALTVNRLCGSGLQAIVSAAQTIMLGDADVAIGGGSTIGLGKAIALESVLPILAVPTTYAGSEMTPIFGLTEGRLKRTG
ncbi:iron-containing alcohol dehydrogenase, partial [Ralstonia pickettii]|nr:iron-containing alcohol dehydrogenase [Ralstonia pickettii]